MNITTTVETIESGREMTSFLKDVYIGVLHRVKGLIKFLMLLLLAVWLLFLCTGLIVSIFGANLEQQKYASVNKIDINEFVLRACQSKSVIGNTNNLDKKLVPDVVQCLGNKLIMFIK